MSAPLPYQCDYALSGKSRCKKCTNYIVKNELRLACRVRSKFNDDFMPNWYHFDCFFEKYTPGGAEQFIDIDIIRYEDQIRVIDSINKKLFVTKKAGKKRKSEAVIEKNHEFNVQYALSGRSRCILCSQNIEKNAIRIGREDTKSEDALQFGAFFRWFCFECFLKVREENEFYGSAETMLGFEALKDKDQKMLMKQIKALPQKLKAKKEKDSENTLPDSVMEDLLDSDDEESTLTSPELAAQLQEQSDKIYHYLTKLKELKKANFDILWGANNQQHQEENEDVNVKPDDTRERRFHVMADALAFGLPRPCPTCGGILRFKNFRYQCTGSIDNQWMKCSFHTRNPVRTELVIPTAIKKLALFKNYKYSEVFAERLAEPTLKSKFVEHELAEMKKVMEGVVKKEKGVDDGDSQSSQSSVDSSRAKIAKVFKPKGKAKTKSTNETTVVMKAGGIVHPEFSYSQTVHVLRHNDSLYSAKLHRTSVENDINSFYIMQILQDDVNPNLIYLFRTWGRVGAAGFNNQTTERVALETAVATFEQIFVEKTHNTWQERKNFVRKYGAYYYTEDIDDSMIQDLNSDYTQSKLNPILLNLLSKLFDKSQMEKTMKEFKIDLEKMPLGKLNQKQLLEACATLKEIGEMIESPDKLHHHRLKSLCEKYYTLVPHSFGNLSITLINSKKQVEEENEMLEALLEMEVAFSIMTKKKDDDPKEDPFDHHYKMLKTELTPLDPACDEYKMIETYLHNTHGSTHQSYKIRLQNIFTIKRQGEEERFRPYEFNPNRKLLWHGSRITNFVGILSQGLRIAPKEAPVSGYMFGKGVYFADSASKSANYCFHTQLNSEGILMLSEVALGHSRELLNAENVTALDPPYLSVKGCGYSIPDPASDVVLPNGCVMPTGKLIRINPTNPANPMSLLYNEYIVYNVAQIKQRYLLNVEFMPPNWH